MVDEQRPPTPGMRGFGPVSVVAACGAIIFSLALLFGDVTLGVVRILAFMVFVAAIFDAYLMFKEGHRLVASGFVVVAILTNPVLAFGVSAFFWVLVFLAVAVFFLAVAFFIRGPGPDPDADVTPDKRFL